MTNLAITKQPKYFFSFWSEHFLGTNERCRAFLDILNTMDGGRWIPERWNDCEPIRRRYLPTEYEHIAEAWTEERPHGSGRSQNLILFRRRTPYALIQIDTSRGPVAFLNSVYLDLAAKPFRPDTAIERVLAIMKQIIRWSAAAYATVHHSSHIHRRGVGGTPLLRLDQMNWITFFGQPYIHMFGHSRLLRAPAYKSFEDLGGIFVLATRRPDDPELTISDRLLIGLEEYLGQDAFAGYGYPEVPCRVPRFDLSETVISKSQLSSNSGSQNIH